MKRWPNFTYSGTTYDLSHLDSWIHRYPIPARDNLPAKTYLVEIMFGHHCFTEQSTSTDDAYLLYKLGDAKNDPRSFSIERYNLSLILRGIIEDLQNRKCINAGNHKFLTISVGTATNRHDYDVYFIVEKTSQTHLRLFVVSAYRCDPSRLHERPKGKRIGLAAILKNISEGRPIRD